MVEDKMIDGIDYENALYNNDSVDVYLAAYSPIVCNFFLRYVSNIQYVNR